MFSEASPSFKIENSFPQGIQKPALAGSWEIGNGAVREQQSGAEPWDWGTGGSFQGQPEDGALLWGQG